jgi:hypothetical protein
MIALGRDWRVDWSARWLAPALVVLVGLLVGALVAFASAFVALGVLIGVAVGLAVLRAPLIGLFAFGLLAYLLPFAVIPVQLGVRLTAYEALLGLTLAAVLARVAVRRSRMRPPAVTLPALGLLLLGLLSFVLSQPYAASQEVSRQVFKLLLAVLVFPLTLHLVRSEGQLRGLLGALMAAATLEALLALVIYRLSPESQVGLLSRLAPLGYPTGDAVLRYLPGENDTFTDILRATGTSIDPNSLGGALMLGAALLLTSAVSASKLARRALLLAAGVVVVGAMILTHSRASWLGLAAAMLVVALVRERRLWLLIGPAAAAVALTPIGRVLYGRVLSGFAGQDKAAGMRLDEYRNALEIVRRHPLLGIGFGAPPTLDLAPGVSSLYLTIAETIGLPALLLFLGLVGCLLLRALRLLLRGRRAPSSRLLTGGLLASLLATQVAALTAGLFDHYFASTAFPHMVALYWLLLALLYRATQLANPRSVHDSDRSPAP